jgi:hypothetical protein
LGILIVAAAVMVLKAAYLIASQPYGFIEAIVLVIMGAALPVWILFSTGYDLINGNLWIHGRPFKWKISTSSISRIEFCRSWISSPALSVDRIRIDYGKGKFIMVSPKRKNQFFGCN